jgi:hypothetical protein
LPDPHNLHRHGSRSRAARRATRATIGRRGGCHRHWHLEFRELHLRVGHRALIIWRSGRAASTAA